MDIEAKEYIKDLADKVSEIYNYVPLIGTFAVVKKMGGTFETPLSFDPFYDGTVEKLNNNFFCIAITSWDKEKHNNLYVGEQIGHVLMHMGFIIMPTIWKSQPANEWRNFGLNAKEQARYFSRCLMMPEDKFKETWNKNKDCNDNINIVAVSKIFNVPAPAAKLRAEELRLL